MKTVTSSTNDFTRLKVMAPNRGCKGRFVQLDCERRAKGQKIKQFGFRSLAIATTLEVPSRFWQRLFDGNPQRFVAGLQHRTSTDSSEVVEILYAVKHVDQRCDGVAGQSMNRSRGDVFGVWIKPNDSQRDIFQLLQYNPRIEFVEL